MKDQPQHIGPEMLAKYFSNECTAQEKAAVDDWRSESVENEQEFKAMEKAHEITNRAPFSADKAWEKVSAQMEVRHDEKVLTLPSAKKKRYTRWLAAASIVLLGTLIGWWQPWVQEQAIYTASMQQTKSVDLPDGSTVTLREGASVEYAENQVTGKRQVQLTGEAFFDVAPRPEHPFVVSTGKTQITVLGTGFNVKSASQLQDEVLVEHGKVSVKSLATGREVELIKGEKAVVLHEKGTVVRMEKYNPNALFWKTRTLHFKYTELDTVVKVLNNLLGISISIKEAEAGKQLITATLENLSVKEMLENITSPNCLTYSKTGDKQYVIHGKGCE